MIFRRCSITLILVFCGLSCNFAQAQTWPVLQTLDTLTARTWTMENGLPVNSTGKVTQDSLGYLWISTYDGLVRFDGLNFEVFNFSNTPEMPHNRTTMLHIQEGVGLWVSLEYGGALLIQNGEFTHFGEAEGYTNSDATQMHEAQDGRMFFVTHAGLFVYQDGQFSRFYQSEHTARNVIKEIYEDTADNTFWAATHGGLLHLDSDGSIIETYQPENSSSNRVHAVMRNNNGLITCATDNGIYQLRDQKLTLPTQYRALQGNEFATIYEDKQLKLFSGPSGLFSEQNGTITTIHQTNLKSGEYYHIFHRDSSNRLWMIGTSGSLALFQNGQAQPFNDIENIGDYFFNSIFEDREGSLWFGTNRQGLLKINKSKVRTLGEKEGLAGGNIMPIYIDSEERLWVSSRGQGINLVEDTSISDFSMSEGLRSNIVQAIEEDHRGNIWLGYHQTGLSKITSAGFQHFDIPGNIESNDVHAIHSTNGSTLWIGTYNGLVRFNTNTQESETFTGQDGLSGIKIRFITEDEDGGLWTASLDGGIARYHQGSFTNYTTEQGLSSNNVRSIYIDEKQPETIWIGTENNGLNRLKDEEIRFVNIDDGLPDHIIHWISQDEHGWLWMSSNRGIFKIDKTELNQYLDGEANHFTLIHYGSAEGMRNPEGNGAFQEAGLRTKDGNFWFATQEGVAIINSNISETNTVPPNVLVSEFTASGKSYPANESVTAPRGIHSFQFHFHALTFNAPEKTRFRYRLKGHEKHWNEQTGKRSAIYANIPAGTYTFEVIAANEDGVWSPEPAQATITIQPHLYQEPWFIALLLLLVIAGYLITSQVRYRYLLKRQQKLKHIIEEQTAQLRKEKNDLHKKNEIIEKQAAELEESNKTKDKFLSLIAHDLRNPFQAILGYSELLLDDVDEKQHPQLKENLGHIYNSSKSLLLLIENLLKWASLQSHSMTPDPEKVHLNTIAKKVTKLLQPSAQQKEIALNFYADDDYYLYADRNMLKTIVRNLTSNALKFTPNGGAVDIKLYRNEDHYLIRIKDTGVGMKPETVQKLLRPDTNTTRAGTNKEKGSGLGLLISKEMITMHQGKLLIDSEEGKGSVFTVKLPAEGLQNTGNSAHNPRSD